ncbi:hypothetical protein GCM10027068_19760 [Prescottella soli]
MWNFQVAGLLVGATIVSYDGSPECPDPDSLWALAARHRVTVLGTSPGSCWPVRRPVPSHAATTT